MKDNPGLVRDIHAEYDRDGKIVPKEWEGEEDTMAREATILYATGQSRNHPSEVLPDYDPDSYPGDGSSGEGGQEIAAVIDSIEPSEAAVGSEDFTLQVSGQNFSANSIIHFAEHDEPTTFENGMLSTGVKPSLWADAVVVQCQVKNGSTLSNAVDFTFTDAGASDDESRSSKNKHRNRR
jgi:hypothetical protein